MGHARSARNASTIIRKRSILVRAKHNRCFPGDEGEKPWAYTIAGEALGELAFTLPARDEQKSRKVRQQLWARDVKISNGGKSRSTSMSSRTVARSRPELSISVREQREAVRQATFLARPLDARNGDDHGVPVR